MNNQPDLERRVTDWLHAEAPARAPDRVLSVALDRVAVVGQERSVIHWRYGDRSRMGRPALIAATVALIALLVATAVFVGNQLHVDVLPVPSVISVPSAVPTNAPAPNSSPATVDTGSAATAIGQVAWTAIKGDATTVPSTEVFATPGGFAAIEPSVDRRSSRFWVSTDGVSWTLAPMPVPATGTVGHGMAAGEHWLWSTSDFRLWRSRDFVGWTEVEPAEPVAPQIAGIRWTFIPRQPVAVGATTILAWHVHGSLALDELLGITLPPDETLIVGTSRQDPALGEARDVYRVRQTVIGADSESGDPVAAIRVELDGSIVTVTDAERDTVLVEIDATDLRIAPSLLAENLNRYGLVRRSPGGLVIADAGVLAFVPPPGLTSLVRLGDGFLALTDPGEGAGLRDVWGSSDGLEWEELGPAVGPTVPSMFQLVTSVGDDLDGPLVAEVVIDDGAGGQRAELWSSADGLTWATLGLMSTYPEPSLYPVVTWSGGYLATADDFQVHVSPTGEEWTVVDGLDGLHRRVDEQGGTQSISVVGDTIFYVDLPLSGDRLLWVLHIDPGG